MNTCTLQMPDYIKPSKFIVAMATHLYRSRAGRGETRGGDTVPN